MNFNTEYAGEFQKIEPKREMALILWARYQAECEAHDRLVCTGPKGRDGAMPANTVERKAMLVFARQANDRMRRKATELEIESEDFEWAKRRSQDMRDPELEHWAALPLPGE